MELLSGLAYNKNMNLDGIDIFIKVVQLGSFTKAARHLNKPVTTVSDKVAQLEKKLGVTLLMRTTRQLKLTDVGSRYFEKCVKAIQEIQAAEIELLQSHSEAQGTLKMTLPVDVAQTILPSLVRKFILTYPKVKLEVMATNRIVNLIDEGIDLALRIGPLNDSSYRVRQYLNTSAFLWVSPELIKRCGPFKKIKDLENLDYVSFFQEKKSYIELKNNSMDQNLATKLKIKVNSRVKIDDYVSIKKIILQGYGFALIPEFVCENEERSGKLIRIFPEWSFGNIHLSFVYPSQKYKSSNVKAFIDLALQEELIR